MTFDHKAGPKAACPADACAEKPKLVEMSRYTGSDLRPFTTLSVDVTGVHWNSSSNSSGTSRLVIYNPSDEMLQSLMLVAMGELELRQELRDRANRPEGCNCYSKASRECPAHKAEGAA